MFATSRSSDRAASRPCPASTLLGGAQRTGSITPQTKTDPRPDYASPARGRGESGGGPFATRVRRADAPLEFLHPYGIFLAIPAVAGPCENSLAPRNQIRYTSQVAIRTFRHKGLKRFFATGSRSGIRPEHASRLRLILALLNAAANPGDLSLPGLRVHELKGGRKGTWSLTVSGNWRVTFSWTTEGVDDVDYEDYH